MTIITPDDLSWRHAGLDATANVGPYTIHDAILRDRNATDRYAIYHNTQHLASFPTLDLVIDYLNGTL